MSNWVLTVGMEIHVELETKTKMFCACVNDPFESAPNTHICPVCYGLPGALPTINQEAVKKVISLGRALKGQIPETTFWARKNYFYPDLPKGYQISQSTAPLVEKAVLTINGEDHQITRIHLEEDAGKLIHASDGNSLVNYNRAGVPLLELVTEPDFHSAESAKEFCSEFQRVLRTLNISSADMEKGQMRCEANISVAAPGELGTKIEVKNINSFRAVEKAIKYEYDRQVALLEEGEVLTQETRSWQEAEGKTVAMRSKETSADYRYFPEPDLPVVALTNTVAEEVLLPEKMRVHLAELGVGKELVQPIIDRGWFEIIKDDQDAADTAKMLLAVPILAQISAELRDQLLQMRHTYGWTIETLKEFAIKATESDVTPQDLAREYKQVDDLDGLIRVVLSEYAEVATAFKEGKVESFNFLVGRVMAASKGRANIQQVRSKLTEQLS